MTDVTVRQITPRYSIPGKPGPYINVMHDEFFVGVWTSVWDHPTYLLRHGITVTLVQFQDKDVAEEWLRKNACTFDTVELLKTLPIGDEIPDEEDEDAEAYI